LQGLMLAQLIIGVLGVLAMTSEYATGTIRTTLAMVPSRLPVLWAKATVVAAVTFPVMLVASLGAFLGGQPLIANGDMATASLGDPGVLRAVVGAAAYLTAVALAGLAIGTLLRATAASIATLFGAVFLLPGLGSVLLPAAWRDDVLKYLPSNAGTAITTVDPGVGLLSPGAGALVLLAWVVVPLAFAARALYQRSV
jgi:ABC-type transport system involved in multi-copper enzyme maturation permease subunit